MEPVGKECEANLWSMIDTFKTDLLKKDEKKVVKQSKKVASTFKHLNATQKEMESDHRKQAL